MSFPRFGRSVQIFPYNRDPGSRQNAFLDDFGRALSHIARHFRVDPDGTTFAKPIKVAKADRRTYSVVRSRTRQFEFII